MGKSQRKTPSGHIENWNGSGYTKLLTGSGNHLAREFVFEYDGIRYSVTMPRPSTVFEAYEAVYISSKDGKPAFSSVKLISSV